MAARGHDVSAALQVLSIAAPDVEVGEIRYFGEGWDNVLFLVNQELVVRIARRDVDSARLINEARTLEAIGPLLPLPVPRPEFIHQPSSEFPFAAIGYRVIHGMPLTTELVTPANVGALAHDLAAFLDRLHGLPAEIVATLTIPHYSPAEWLGRHDVLVSRTDSDLRQNLDPVLYSRFRAWWSRYHENPAATAFEPCLIHGDLAAEHILVESSPWRISGVIDFGDAMIADPGLDLAGLPDDLAQAVMQRMRGVANSNALWLRRDAYRRFVPLHAVFAGRDRDDLALLDAGIQGIRNRFSR